MICQVAALTALSFLLLTHNVRCSESEAMDSVDSERYLTAYKVGLKLKVQEQLMAIKNIEKFNTDTKLKFLNTSLLNIFSVYASKRVKLANDEDQIFSNLTGVLGGTDGRKEDVSLILENTALFGHLMLRYPDQMKGLLSKLAEEHVVGENSTLHWAVQFSERFGMALFNNSLDSFHLDFPVYRLMKQELNLAERDPDYSNPFSLRNVQERQAEEARLQKQREEEQRKKNKKLNRGPRLSGVTRTAETKKRVRTEL